MHMRARSVPMRLLVAPRRHLRRMRMLRAARQHEGAAGRALAARGEVEQLEVLQVGNEIRLPDVEPGDGAAVDRDMPSLALPLIRLADALGKLGRIVEDEIAVVIEVE